MKPKGPTEEGGAKYAYLLKPAKNLMDNFDVDLLATLDEYLENIRDVDDDRDMNNYERFNFPEACMLIQGASMILGKKVDLLCDQAFDVFDVMKSSGKKGGGAVEGEGHAPRRRGRRQAVDTGIIDYKLIDVFKELKTTSKRQKDVKVEIAKSLQDITGLKEMRRKKIEFEKENMKRDRPSHYNFGSNKCQFFYNDLQLYSAKKRPEVLGKTRDFWLKKSSILPDTQIPLLSEVYTESIDAFTLPGAVEVPDNRDLALVFGIPELEFELNMENNENAKPTPFGPFKDPLSGRQIVAPPKWFLDQEITRVQSRLSDLPRDSRARFSSEAIIARHSTESQPARLSDARQRTKDIMTFIERRNKASTLLTEAVVKAIHLENADGKLVMDDDDDDDMFGAGGMSMGGDQSLGPERPIRRSEMRQQQAVQKKDEPWVEIFRNDPLSGQLIDEASTSAFKHRPFAEIKVQLHTHEYVAMKRRAKEEKKRTTREVALETFDYIQHNYYWREKKITLNKENDWRIEVLRVFIFKRQREKQKKRLEAMRQKRNGEAKGNVEVKTEVPDETMELGVDGGNGAGAPGVQQPENVDAAAQKRSLGHELMDMDDADVSIDLGGNFGDDDDDYQLLPTNEAAAHNLSMVKNVVPEPLKFSDIDDVDLADLIGLTNDQFLDAGLPLIQKFKANVNSKDQIAYEMARAYNMADVDATNLQSRVDEWQEKIEPILEEELLRKEFDIHEYGTYILHEFEEEGQEKYFQDMMRGIKWYEISRYFLSCLLMANTGNVEITNKEDLNSMRVRLLTRNRHHEVFERDGAM